MSAAALSPLAVVLGVAAYWIALGIVGLWLGRERDAVHVLYPAGAVGAVLLAWCGWLSMGAPPQLLVLPLGLPDLPFHLRIDALSGFFLLLLGAASAGVLVYSTGYFRGEANPQPGLTCLQVHLFLAAMAMVLVADDAYLFMVAWETMALASYFLVVTDHRVAGIRSAGFLYLLMAHLGAVAILLTFGVLQAGAGQYTFEAMRGAGRSEAWAGLAFVLALLGFGAKAGFLPLHAWLPEAHPAAPSPVSALMSGVMLKTAVYGLLRVGFDLAGEPAAWWGVAALGLGLVTALFGVMFAAVQTDMKRLLAYSSIENLGIVLAALGLSLVFRHHGMVALAALALAAALYHCLNHAMFKSLLFCATGSVMHATSQRSLGHLGGLVRRMPWVAATALVGALAIAGLPPLNGFASEWLLLQAFLLSPQLPDSYLRMFVPIATAALVLAAAFAAYVMVKFYGVVFLGRPREPGLREAHDAGPWERAALAYFAAACVLLGVLPAVVLRALEPVSELLLGQGIGAPLARGWVFLTPASPDRASYSPLLFLVVVAGVIAATWLLVRQTWHARTRRADPWDCGFPAQTARMQDTAEGFGQPIKQIFEPFFRIERHVPDPFDEAPRYAARTEDRLWHWLYLPVARLAARISALLAPLQHGRIHLYLVYSFATLLFLLLVIRA
jgi:formate hydrogenlyase subunit 3/multisubunit Na+/H+ antiporter MnhD subunit